MEIFKIVFTGGPCAGKTTQINLVRKFLEDKGYTTICVSETATDVINGGFKFEYVKNLIKFQTLLIKAQNFKEEIVNDNINEDSEKVVILYDRGILDNKAYFDNHNDFNYVLKAIEKNEINILDSYDIVIDLLSLASCNPDKYNTSSNNARTETLNQAAQLDEKTSNVWAGHNNLCIFNSNISIDDEFKLIIDKIENLINKTCFKDITSIEINNRLSDFDKYDDSNSRLINIEKIILDNECYILRRTYKRNVSYVLCVQNSNNSFNKTISFNEYIEYITKNNILTVEKYQSLNFIRNKQLFEIKFYDDHTVLEYEENKLNEKVVFPDEIKFDNNKRYVKL